MPFVYMRTHQKKVLWILVIVIVPTFCLTFGVASFSRNRAGEGTAGRVMGRKISRSEFENAYARWHRTMNLTGSRMDRSEEQMWRSYSMVIMADIWGIRVPDKEVVDSVKQVFGGENDFNIEKTAEILARFGLTLRDYEKTAGEMIKQGFLMGHIASAAKLTKSEAEYMYRHENVTAGVSLIRFQAEDYTDDIEAEPGEVRRFFTENSRFYAVPEKFKFEYVAAKLTDMEERTEISEEAIIKYYEENKENYREPLEEKEEAEGDTDAEPRYKPLEEVREAIESRLKRQQAASVADKAIREFEDKIDEISKDQSPEAIDLEQLAARMKLSYDTTDFLMARELYRLHDLSAAPDRIKYICELEPGYPSIAVKGYRAYFVARLLKKQESYVSDLAEIVEQVNNDYIHGRAVGMALENAANFVALAREKSFKEVYEKQELLPKEYGPFKTSEIAWQIDGANQRLGMVISITPVGEIAGPVLCGDAAVVVNITDRAEPDMTEFERQWKEFIEERTGPIEKYKQAKTEAMIGEWMNSIETEFISRDTDD